MKVDVLLGLQWGDEGKGKVVDVLAPQYDVVARFQGGPNAGHTLHFDGNKHVLHQIPSGIFRLQTKNIIGNGVVLNPVVFRQEVAKLEKYVPAIRKNLLISKKSALILPTHPLLDQAYEAAKGDQKIGSTLKGIGPAYQDKIGRQGVRVGDVLSPRFEKKYKALVQQHIAILRRHLVAHDWPALEAEFLDAIAFLREFPLVDSEFVINQSLQKGERVLAEGAQGSLLDIDFGNYPFVTSSNTISAGACTGLGVSPGLIGEVFGIFKAYCTRVGSGPFPTELFDETGDKMRRQGNEFGSTTGRPRRCGWIDLPSLKYSIMINGVTQLFMMKADVLQVFPTIRVCTRYRLANGEQIDYLPYELCDEDITPVYEELPGWNTPLQAGEPLPPALEGYIKFLEKNLKTPITLVSIGPDREQTIFREKIIR